MTGEKTKAPVEVKIGASASAELRVSTEIPSASSGRLIDALTDIFRPFSEARGLKADQIRLQREEVLILIAEKARRRAALEDLSVKPVPNKFLVPFFEKASLEEVENELVTRWAHLLLSASDSFDAEHIRFCSVLSEIGSKEVNFLIQLVRSHGSDRPLNFLDDVPLVFDDFLVQVHGGRVLSKVRKADAVFRHLVKELEHPGGIIESITYDRSGTQYDYWNTDVFPRECEGIKAVLASLGLVAERKYEIVEGELFLMIHVVHLTTFGTRFLLACDRDLAKEIDDLDKAAMERAKAEGLVPTKRSPKRSPEKTE